MTPSIYDMRGAEVDNAARIRRDRALAIAGGIIAAPFALAALVAWVVCLACM